jgi:hypothetical protein
MIDFRHDDFLSSCRLRDSSERSGMCSPYSSLNRLEIRYGLRYNTSRRDGHGGRRATLSASREAKSGLGFVFAILALALKLVNIAFEQAAVAFAYITSTSAAELRIIVVDFSIIVVDNVLR